MKQQQQIQSQEEYKKKYETLSDSSINHFVLQTKINPVGSKQQKFTSFTNIQKYLHYFNFQNLLPGNQKSTTSKDNEIQKNFDLNSSLKNLKANCEEDKQQIRCPLIDNKIRNLLSDFQALNRQKIQKRLLQSKRFQKVDSFVSEILIHKIFPSKHYQIIRMQIQMLSYKTEICILNEHLKNPLHSVMQISGSGSFGVVYFVKILEEQLAIKSIWIQKSQKIENSEDQLKYLSKSILLALKEYFFFLLFSQLEIAPQTKTIGGFDLIIYEDCIQFATEICEQPHKGKKQMEEISKSLFEMHMLQVVHRDIKNTNILYSPRYKKNVFIDFGCAQALNQTLGEKSKCRFAGTPVYCTKQVMQLLNNKQLAVDLYFNDLFGLEKFIAINEKIETVQISRLPNISKWIAFDTILMKFNLYNHNYEKFDLIWRLAKINYPDIFEQIEVNLLSFLTELKPNEFLRMFYWTRISQATRMNPNFTELDTIFKNKTYQFLSLLTLNPFKSMNFGIHKLLYRTLAINYGKLTSKEKKVELILIDKKSIETFICQFKQQAECFDSMQNLKKQKLYQFCLVVSHYSALNENNYQIQIEDKIRVCTEALKLIRQFDLSSLEKINQFFECPYQSLQPINLFYHYFTFEVLNYLPFKYKSESMIKSVSSLCLLGFPTNYNFTGVSFLLHSLISFDSKGQQNSKNKPELQFAIEASEKNQILDQETRIQKIIMLWQCKFIFLLFNNVFYDRKKVKPKKIHSSKHHFEIQKIQSELMLPKKDDKNEFFYINYIFFDLILTKISEFNEKACLLLVSLLKSSILTKLQQNCEMIKQWKQLMYIVVCYFSLALKLEYSYEILKNLSEQTIILGSNYKPVLPFLTFFYFYEASRVHIQLYYVLKKIDEAIGFEQLSLRFETKNRVQIALNRKDISSIRQIFNFISKEINPNSVEKQNIKFLGNILVLIQGYFKTYFNSLPKLSQETFQILAACYDMIEIAIIMAQNYIEEKTQSGFFVTIPQVDIDNICLKSIQMELTERKDIKNFSIALLQMTKAYRKIFQILTIDPAINHSQKQLRMEKFNKSLKIMSLNQSKLCYWKDKILQFPKKMSDFLKDLSCNRKVFEYSFYWMKVINKNQQLKRLINQNRSLSLIFITNFLYQKSDLITIEDRLKIVEDFFGEISVDRFKQQVQQENLPTIQISLDYLHIKLVQTGFQLDWCEQIIQFFRLCGKRDQINYIIGKVNLVRVVFNSYIYSKKGHKQMHEYFQILTAAVTKSPKKQFVRFLSQQFSTMLWCKCDNCFLRQVKHWNPYSFTQYLFQNVDMQKINHNPYMALVYLYSMKNKALKRQVNRKFVVFILKAIPYLNSKAKQLIKTQIYYFVYETLPQRSIAIYFDNDKLIEPVPLSVTTKSKMNQRIHRQFLYYYNHFKKHQQSHYDTLQDLIEKRFIKQYYIKGYCYPNNVKKLYAKKLRRYYEVNQNYKQTRKIAELSNLQQVSLSCFKY